MYTPNTYLRGAWSMTVASGSSRRLDAFDQWCLRRIGYIFHIRRISPTKKWGVEQLGQPPAHQLSQIKRRDFICSDILR